MRFTPLDQVKLSMTKYMTLSKPTIVEEYVIPSGEAGGDEVYTTTITVPAVAASTKAVVTTATRIKE